MKKGRSIFVVTVTVGQYDTQAVWNVAWYPTRDLAETGKTTLDRDYQQALVEWGKFVAAGNPYMGDDPPAYRIVPTRLNAAEIVYAEFREGYSLDIEEIPLGTKRKDPLK